MKLEIVNYIEKISSQNKRKIRKEGVWNRRKYDVLQTVYTKSALYLLKKMLKETETTEIKP